MNDVSTGSSNLIVGSQENVSIIVSVEGVRIDSGVDWSDADSNMYQLVVLSVTNDFITKSGTGFTIQRGLQLNKTKALVFSELGSIVKNVVYAGGFWGSLWKGIKAIPSVIGAVGDIANRTSNAINQGTAAFNSVQGSGITIRLLLMVF